MWLLCRCLNGIDKAPVHDKPMQTWLSYLMYASTPDYHRVRDAIFDGSQFASVDLL
jgi:hypothetical protein